MFFGKWVLGGFVIVVVFQDKIFLCNPAWLGTQRSTCPCLLSAWIKGVCHYLWLKQLNFICAVFIHMSLHSLQVTFGLYLVLNEPSLVIRDPLTLWQFIFIFLENYNAVILINWQSFSAIGCLFIVRIKPIIQVLCLVMVAFLFLCTGICKQSILESSM